MKWLNKIPGSRRIYVFALKLKYHLFLAHKNKRIAVETIRGKPVLVLPEVMNPKLFRTGEFLAECLAGYAMAADSVVLDLGTGCGVVSVFLPDSVRKSVAIDINPQAVKCARLNVLLHDLAGKVSVYQGDLFESVQGEQFDVIIFNPPYLDGQPQNHFEKALFGIETIVRFAREVTQHLSEQGKILLLLSSIANEQQILGFFDSALQKRVCSEKHFFNETLRLYELVPKKTGQTLRRKAVAAETEL